MLYHIDCIKSTIAVAVFIIILQSAQKKAKLDCGVNTPKGNCQQEI